jgi:hypothetical protein
MPRFPTYQRQQSLQGGSTGSYAGDAIAAPARALQQAGEGIANAGSDIAVALNKTRESQDDTWFSKARAETAVDMIGVEQEAQKGATDGAKDYTTGMSQRFQEYRQQKVAGAPSKRAQTMYDQWADTYGVDVTQKASRFQAESELAKRATDFSDAMNAHAQAIYADPSQYDAVVKRAMDDFEGAKQWMTPEQEAISREKVDHDLKLSRAKHEADFKPADFIAEVGQTVRVKPSNVAPDVKTRGQQAMGFFMGKGYTKAQAAGIVGNLIAESNLKASGAVGDNGTAFGVAQWRGERLTRLKRFSNANGRDWQDFETQLAFVDMELQNHETGAYRKLKNAKTVDEATAAFIGYERPAGWSEGNPRGGHNYKGRLSHAAAMAGEQEIAFHEGGDFSADPRYAGLSIDEVRSLTTQAEQTVNAERTALYNQMKDSMQLGIATGQVISEDQILGSALGDGDKASLLGQFRTKNKDEAVISQTLAALADRSLNVSPYDAEATKALDTISERAEKGGSLEQFVQSSEEIVRQSGIVPKPYMNRIRQGLESTNVEQVGAAAELARRVGQIDPAAFGRRDGGSKVADAATAYSHYVDTVGMTPEQAAQRLIDMNDPEKVKARASLMESKPTKDWITKKATESNVRDIFDPGVFGFDPTLGSNPAQSAAMVGEYRSILEESLWDANGDQELAVTFAGQRFAKRYGTSSFSLDGETAVTRLPPEKTYPVGADGTHGYIMDQVIHALKENGVDASNVYLQSDDMTNRDYSTGQPARYQVFFEKDGGIERFGLPFYALPEAESGVPRSTIEESRGRRNTSIEIERRRQDALEESGMQNSPLMSTDPNAVR